VVTAPALYAGTVTHRRHYPRRHAFSYAVFMSLLDVDRLREAMQVSRWTSFNAFNWMSFDERDHQIGPGATLRERLQHNAAAAGHQLPAGRILLLTHLRCFNYVFNPISIYYCHDAAGELRLVMADVRNTYGGRHQYWLQPRDPSPRRFRSTTPKRLFVSPFMQGAMDYEFVLAAPGERLIAHMNVFERGGGRRHFDASLQLGAVPWTAANVRRALMRFPAMTFKVIAAIHWQAMRLRWRRVPESHAERAS
jgi:DUF1365 family protein